MEKDKLSRKLAVILHADVVSSTNLVQKNESLAHVRIQNTFRALSETVATYDGLTCELRGDALLAEFDNTSDAVIAALTFQKSNHSLNQDLIDDIKPEIRIGIALGEVINADSTVTGAGVVIAQRLEQLADANGVVVQGAIHEALPNRLPISFDFLGDQALKGFDVPVRAFKVRIEDDQEFSNLQRLAKPDPRVGLKDYKTVKYCSSADGASIAYTQTGQGYPMVAVGSWMTHLEYDWSNPVWGPFIRHLSDKYALIRYDQRGNGMSDWHGIEISFERMVEDLEAVIGCFNYDKVALFGPSQAAAVSISYALNHPHRVSHLVLLGSYARGRCKRGTSEGKSESQAMVTMIRQNWGNENPVARQMMTSLFFPDAESQEAKWFNDFQKKCGPADNMALYREVFDNIDISDHVSEIQVPCLVIHSDGDSVAPISEGKFIAARVPGAKMITVHSNSHMVEEDEPGFQKIIDSIYDFV